ncbi:MAG: DUF2232 domain-containing protein [bacterium]
MPPGEGRPEAKLAAALVIVSLAPAGKILPLVLLLHIPAIGALLYLWYRRQYLIAGLAMLMTLIITGFWLGLSYSVFLLCSFALPATGLACLRQRGRSLMESVAGATLVPVITLIVTYSSWHEAVQLFAGELKLWATTPELSSLQGWSGSAAWATQINWLADTVALLFPALVLLFLATLIFTGALLGLFLSREAKVYRTTPLRFVWWKMPEWSLAPLGLAVILLLFEAPLLSMIGWNLLLVMFVLYSLCGFSLLEYLLRHYHLRGSLKVLIYVSLFLTQIIGGVLLPLAALFDAHFDFRKVRAKRIG